MLKNLFYPLLFIAIILFSLTVNAQQELDQVINPKTSGGGYVSNADNLISKAAVNALNLMLKPLDEQGKAQIAVVLVHSIGNQVPKDFATALFRKWGIGDRKKNNGLLILIVYDQRRMEFEVGYGLEGVLTDLTSQRIQQGLMVPYFKKGDYDTGVLKGIELVASTINTGIDQSLDKDNLYPEIGLILFQDILFFIFYIIIYCWYVLSERGKYVTQNASFLWLIFLLFGPLIVVCVLSLATPIFVTWDLFLLFSYVCWSVFFSLTLNKMLKMEVPGDNRIQQYQYLKLVTGGIFIYTILFPLPFLFIRYLAAKRRLQRLRYAPYESEDGLGEMILMTENRIEELTKEEQTEEELDAVSYDLWKAKDGSVMKLRYLNQDTKIRRCKKCRSMTAKRTERVVEKKATTENGGMISIYYTCQVCGKKDFVNESIAKKPKKDFFKGFTSGDGSSGGNSNRSSSGSSSNSSSSSSWGGGSSGGGGSGSSW